METLTLSISSSFFSLLLVGGLLLFFLSKFSKAQLYCLPYVAVPLLTEAERRFFLVLEDVLPKRCHLLAQVRLANLVHVKPGIGTASRCSCGDQADFDIASPRDML
jgi:hypothetical protein